MKNILLTFVAIVLTACAAQPVVPPSPEAAAEKQEILNVVEAGVKQRHHINVSLSAQYLKVQDGWAYIETTGGGDPSVNAVLRKIDGKWHLARPVLSCIPICPAGQSNCADGEMLCKNTLHQQFPATPISVFRSPNSRVRVLTSK